ncbi:MAG: hypothetical protein FD169_1065 [Bacillota bacterium]|nr:MAG: hypothetical protein FD169_1065 [Bacillota bacterium]
MQEDLARHGTNSALGQQALQKSLQYYNSELDSMRRLHEIGGNESQELKQLDIQLASARVELLKFKNDYLIGIDSTIEQNRLSLMELAATLEKAQAAVDAYQKRAETVTTTVLDKLRFDTLVSIYEQESAYQERMRDIDDKLKAVNLTMSEATVVAPTDGTVNIIADIAPGEVLNNSVEVATIVPDTDTEFKIVFDVSNKDISGVKPGQV